MSKLIDKFMEKQLDKWTQKQKLVCVPENWHKDYVKMASEKVKNKEAMATIITEYNSLLKDFYLHCSARELCEILTDAEVDFKNYAPKEELAEMAYQEFKITYENK